MTRKHAEEPEVARGGRVPKKDSKMLQGRDAKAGKFLSVEEARQRPSTAIVERVPQPGYGDTRRGRVLKDDQREEILEEYDATALVGLRTIIYGAAIKRIDADGEETIEIPNLDQLIAAAAVARCLMQIKLQGAEIKAMRRIAKMTMGELAQALGERTAAETIARWESEVQPMGGYAEKILRLVICARLSKEAPGVEYADGAIAHLKVCDPWLTHPTFEVPPLEFRRVKMKESSGSISDVWDPKLAA